MEGPTRPKSSTGSADTLGLGILALKMGAFHGRGRATPPRNRSQYAEVSGSQRVRSDTLKMQRPTKNLTSRIQRINRTPSLTIISKLRNQSLPMTQIGPKSRQPDHRHNLRITQCLIFP